MGAQPDGGSDGGVTLTTEPQLVELVAASTCKVVEECLWKDGFDSGTALFLGENCNDVVLSKGESRYLENLEESIGAGRVSYDDAAFKKCLADYEALCTIPNNPTFLCAEAFKGTVPADGQCTRSEECSGDAYCTTSLLTCPGSCKPRKQLQEDCVFSRDCSAAGVDDVACLLDQQSQESTCVGLRYQTPVALGGDCDTTDMGNGVRAVSFCEDGLSCDTDTFKCVTPPKEDEACTDGQACEPGTLCLDNVCKTATVKNTVGDTCDPDNEVVCNTPVLGLFCVNDECAALSDGTAGASCRTVDDFFSNLFCNDPLICDTISGTCGMPKGTGDDCNTGAECESGYCDLNSNQCGATYCSD